MVWWWCGSINKHTYTQTTMIHMKRRLRWHTHNDTEREKSHPQLRDGGEALPLVQRRRGLGPHAPNLLKRLPRLYARQALLRWWVVGGLVGVCVYLYIHMLTQWAGFVAIQRVERETKRFTYIHTCVVYVYCGNGRKRIRASEGE